MHNKLTDAEVKKALECCGKNILCIHCPLYEMQLKEGLVCEDRLKLYAIDLINRQEAEIRHLDQESDVLKADVENVNRINDELNAENESLKAEVEDLAYKLGCLLCHATGGKLSKHTYPLRVMESYVNDNIQDYCDEAEAEAKAEAYKECLDELARRLGYAFLSKHSCVLDIMENLLNELVGDGDA